MSTRGGVKGLDIPSILEALESDPLMTGKASTTWQLNSRGNTTDDLIANLRGPAKLTTQGVVLKDIGIEKMLCQAVALVNQQKLAGKLSDDSVFKDLSMDIELGGGKARLKPLRADLQDVTLRGTGELDLKVKASPPTSPPNWAPGWSNSIPPAKSTSAMRRLIGRLPAKVRSAVIPLTGAAWIPGKLSRIWPLTRPSGN